MEKLKADLAAALVRVRQLSGLFTREAFTDAVAKLDEIVVHFDERLKVLERAVLPAQPAPPADATKPAA
jgi:hypothetical protein